MKHLEILSVTSEFFPLIKTGGLADVAGALPAALSPEGIAVTTLLPGYPAVLKGVTDATLAHEITDLFGGPARLLRGTCGRAKLIVLDAPHLFDRPGNPYLDAGGQDYADNPQRFAALSYIGAAIGRGLMPGYLPDVVHGHDWQAGLMPAYLHFRGDAADAGTTRPPSVMTVHNLAFQGLCDAALLSTLRLPPQAFSIQGVEFYGRISFLKAGLRLANHITTVSPTYAREICTPEGGMGLDGLLRSRGTALSGILNGIDTDVWNPATDVALPQRFSQATLAARAENKAALCARFGLEPERLLFGVVSRLTTQKGLDLLPASLSTLRAIGASVVILGAGDAALERIYAEAARPGEMGLYLGYDETLAHLIYAGADALLIPSRFEPCGLTQLCAMRYGCLPVVTRVGGLADTVIDANEAAIGAGVATGFQMAQVDNASLDLALQRVGTAWGDRETWEAMQRNALTAEVGWARSARRYADLYRGLVV